MAGRSDCAAWFSYILDFKVHLPGTCLWRVLEEKISQSEVRIHFSETPLGCVWMRSNLHAWGNCRLLRICVVQTDRVRRRER